MLFYLNYRQTRQTVESEYVARAAASLLTAESVREEMGRKWRLGLFDKKMLSQWAKEGHMDRVLAAVPVVTAWQSAQAKAKEGGYEFRVPKLQPRNPKNEPDALETRALNALTASNLDEYHEIDPQRNAVRYFRPVRLTQDCLLCHGSPSQSKDLWGNADGKDPTGTKMEDWHEGEVHGAFEIVKSLDEADAQTARTLCIGGAVVTGFLVLSGLVFFLVVTRSITNPLRATVAAFRKIAEGDLTQQLTIDSKDEIGELGRIGQCHDRPSAGDAAWRRHLFAGSRQGGKRIVADRRQAGPRRRADDPAIEHRGRGRRRNVGQHVHDGCLLDPDVAEREPRGYQRGRNDGGDQ